MGCGIAAVVAPPARGNERPLAQDRRSFRGSRPGEERNVDGITLCWCPPGRFAMGSPASEPGRRPDETQVEVTLTRGFWTAKHEATQGQWRRVFGTFPDRPPSAEFGEGDDFPAYWINFDEAEAFCARLTQSARRSAAVPEGWAFTLPTEAQWEYACRAGTSTATAFGDTMHAGQANFVYPLRRGDPPPPRRAVPVGSYAPNAWGLYDMHGNVFEWCRDWYHPRLPGGVDPDLSGERGIANRDGTYSRVRRGGAWNDELGPCRSAYRLRYEPERSSDHIGFRIAAIPA
jgi:formylglycine-generating enzyme required for sulfatase activity